MSSQVVDSIQIAFNDSLYWQGLGRQNLDFHQAIGELIDNSISAAGYDEEEDLKPFRVEIVVIRDGEKVTVIVADESSGISKDELKSKIMNMGGQGDIQGPMNEHGFGLKNCICKLSNGNTLPWNLQTRNEVAAASSEYYLIKGPLSINMNIFKGDPSKWNENLVHITGDIGTRVKVETTFQYLRTLYLSARTDLNRLMRRLGEHLGVMYRGYLRNKSNKMWLRWHDSSDGVWYDKRLHEIEIPYKGKKETYSIPIEVNGKKTKVEYWYGEVDENESKSTDKPWPYPLMIYYRHNIPTSGIDIIVRNRVIKTRQIREIWPEINRNPDYNYLTGEIILDENFRTVNNKIDMDAHNPFWQQLLKELNEEDEVTKVNKYKPPRNRDQLTETEIRKQLSDKINASVTGSTVTQNRTIWTGTGVKIDIYVEKINKDIEIYEVKTGQVKPLDVYQLLMYWDGVVHDLKVSPKLGRLVGSEIPDSVKTLLIDINKKEDALGNPYIIEYKNYADWGVSL